jgi:hypothetical protein
LRLRKAVDAGRAPGSGRRFDRVNRVTALLRPAWDIG